MSDYEENRTMPTIDFCKDSDKIVQTFSASKNVILKINL